jgi:hypothetical protein
MAACNSNRLRQLGGRANITRSSAVEDVTSSELPRTPDGDMVRIVALLLRPGALSDGAAGVLVENVAVRAHHAAASLLSIWSHSSERFSLNVTSPLRLRTERLAAASSCSRTGSSR